MHMSVQKCILVCLETDVFMCTCVVHVYVQACICAGVYVHVYMYTCISDVHTCKYVFAPACEDMCMYR